MMEAIRIGCVGLQVIRDRALRFNMAGPGGLRDRKASGKTLILDESQRKALVALRQDAIARNVALLFRLRRR